MMTRRIVPILLLSDRKIVKTIKFKEPKYIGDPINIVRIFNDKEVDELMLIDIDASIQKKSPQFDYIAEVVSEAFIPMTYGGGVTTLEDVRKLLTIGVEKISINTQTWVDLELIAKASKEFGAQSVVAGIDINQNFFKQKQIYNKTLNQNLKNSLAERVRQMVDAGAGEIFLQFAYLDGTMQGLNQEMIREICAECPVPVVVSGGVGQSADIKSAFQSGASAVAAGSLFVYHGPHKAVLINYPSRQEIKNLISN